jgi:phosphosulfolactate synthase
MNFKLDQIPERTEKPRQSGITMMMDKGLSLGETEDFISVASLHVDIVKLGFGSAYVTPRLEEKIALYREAGIPVYFGGTLLEAFLVRGQFDDFRRTVEKFKVSHVEVSDGALDIPHEEKCKIIATLAKDYTVLSEVGSKDAEIVFAPYKWIQLMKEELDAGSWKVITEAREGGNVGIFRSTGEVRSDLIDEILTTIPSEKILWEAPNKAQQVWFINMLGQNVNLGNIPHNEVLPLETLRLGLRADTFYNFLDTEKIHYKRQEVKKPHA